MNGLFFKLTRLLRRQLQIVSIYVLSSPSARVSACDARVQGLVTHVSPISKLKKIWTNQQTINKQNSLFSLALRRESMQENNHLLSNSPPSPPPSFLTRVYGSTIQSFKFRSNYTSISINTLSTRYEVFEDCIHLNSLI